ncbi:hypothetical protein SERLA73DRAFT_181898, partial [Serpula lacrymans var. lacrymans S7.3]
MNRTLSPVLAEHIDVKPNVSSAAHRRQSFTRSRSPHVRTLGHNAGNGIGPHPFSPSPLSHRHRSLPQLYSVLSMVLSLQVPLPFIGTWTVCMDTRKAGESVLLLGTLLYMDWKISGTLLDSRGSDPSLSLELYTLIIISFIYIVWTHSSLTRTSSTPSSTSSIPEQLRTSPSPRVEARENRRHTVHSPPGGIPRKSHFSFAWMTVPKNYRESSDDGILTGFLLGPIIASAMLYSSLQQAASASSPDYSPLPRAWRIEEPRVLLN